MFNFLKTGLGKVGSAGKALINMEVGLAKKLVGTFGSANLIYALWKRLRKDAHQFFRPVFIAFQKNRIAPKPEFAAVMKKYQLSEEDVARKYRAFVNLAYAYLMVTLVFLLMAIYFSFTGQVMPLLMTISLASLPVVYFFKYSLHAAQCRQREMLTAKEFFRQAGWWKEAFH